MTLLVWIALGLLAGFIGSRLFHHTGSVIALDVVLGVIGAIVGGLAFNSLGLPRVTEFNLYSLFVAVAGSVLLLIVYHNIFRRA